MSSAGPHRALTPLVEASTQLRALCLQTWGCAPTTGTAVPVSTNRESGTRKNGKEPMAKNCPPKNHLAWVGGRTGLQNNQGVSAFLIFIKVWWHSKNSFTQLVKNSLSCALYLALREGHALWETLFSSMHSFATVTPLQPNVFPLFFFHLLICLVTNWSCLKRRYRLPPHTFFKNRNFYLMLI